MNEGPGLTGLEEENRRLREELSTATTLLAEMRQEMEDMVETNARLVQASQGLQLAALSQAKANVSERPPYNTIVRR